MHAKSRRPAIPRPWLRQGQRWWVFAPPFVMMALAVGANVLIGVGLARLLEPAALGKYMVMIAAAGMVSLFGSRGQPMLTKRLYALRPPGTYDWLRDLADGLRYSLPVLVVVLLGAILLYRLPADEAVQLTLLVLLSLVLLFLSQVLQAARHHALGNVLVRVPNAVLLGMLTPFFMGRYPLTLEGAVALRIVAALVACGIGAVWLFRKTARGTEIIRREVYGKGEMLRKLVVVRKGGELSYPYLIYWTDYSARRAEALKVSLDLAATVERAEAIASELLEKNLAKGWERIGT